MRITLSLHDIGGQERFDFFKTDFYKGTAAVAAVFDLSRPDTYEQIETYFNDIRERSGNIPIILVGNKQDLLASIGHTVKRKKIIKKINQKDLVEYLETSALENVNVEKLFKTLALAALLDLKPRLGEIIDSNHIRFKVLLIGDASVGKSSLIKKFINKDFDNNYKITVGLDLLVKDITIPDDDLPKEAHEIVKNAVLIAKKRQKQIKKLEKLGKPLSEESAILDSTAIIDVDGKEKRISSANYKKKRYAYIGLISLVSCILILLFFLILF